MWILNFLPASFFHIIGIVGILAVLSGILLKKIPFINTYSFPIQIVGFVIVCLSLFFEGAIYNNAEWVLRVKEMEEKVAAAEVESKKENVKIVQKVVIQQQLVKERGEDIIKYVDREITKYDSSCVIPNEFVKALNDAARDIR